MRTYHLCHLPASTMLQQRALSKLCTVRQAVDGSHVSSGSSRSPSIIMDHSRICDLESTLIGFDSLGSKADSVRKPRLILCLLVRWKGVADRVSSATSEGRPEHESSDVHKGAVWDHNCRIKLSYDPPRLRGALARVDPCPRQNRMRRTGIVG
jgi:hypothetical protein